MKGKGMSRASGALEVFYSQSGGYMAVFTLNCRLLTRTLFYKHITVQ